MQYIWQHPFISDDRMDVIGIYISPISEATDMQKLDLNFVRNQFAAFSEPCLDGTIFLENAGGSYMCDQVSTRLNHYYRTCKIQPYYPNPVSEKAGSMMDEAYTSLAPWLNVNPEQIYFGPSTSQNTNVLSNAMLGWLEKGDEIIVTNQDHEANIGAWRKLTKSGVIVKEWQVDPCTGQLDIAKLSGLITDKTKLLTFPHCSNILGEINPVAEICSMARKNGVKTLVDGVSFAGHGLPDVAELGCDIYLLSLYKVFGPHQGVMVISAEMASLLENQSHYFNDVSREKRLLPAGPDHAQIAAVKGVSDYFDALAQHHLANGLPQGNDASLSRATLSHARGIRQLFHSAEQALMEPLLSYFSHSRDFTVIGSTDLSIKAPTISVIADNHRPWDLAKALGEQGICCGAGHFYSIRLLKAMNINPETGVLRFSLVHYTSENDVSSLISSLDTLVGS
jgi:selenocysteine lyase/cysteine desulfurase